jgi:D-hydroxyproline dehydrogenase subunit beta
MPPPASPTTNLTHAAGSCDQDSTLSADAVVVGAGIIGASCAYALALRGLSVHLIERDAPARGASGACEGNLVLFDRPTLADLQLARWSFERWAELEDELLEATGIDIEFDRKGSLMLAQDGDAAAAARAKCAWLADQGVEYQWLDSAALHDIEPDLAPGVGEAAYFPADAQIEPRLATAALVAGARRHGAVAHLHEPALSIRVATGDGHGIVTTARHTIEAARVVVAAGVWTDGLLDGVANLQVTARKGQIAVVRGGNVNVRHKVIEAAYAHTVASDESALQVATVVESTRSGSILLGSSRLATQPEDRSVDVDVLNMIVARAISFFPDLARSRLIRSYSGLRPMAADHTPIVGPLPSRPAIFVATGHEGGGVMMAAATGELVARQIVGQVAPVAVTPYLPGRFLLAGSASPSDSPSRMS